MAMRMSNVYVADRRLYLDKDGGVVEASDPRRASLLIGKGCQMPMEQAERLGLVKTETPEPPNVDAIGVTQRLFGFRISCTAGTAPATGRATSANVQRATETRRQRRRRAERTRRKTERAAAGTNHVTTELPSGMGGNGAFRRRDASDICSILLAVLSSAICLPLLPFQTHPHNAA